MQKSILAIIDPLKEKLLLFPSLVDLLKEKNPLFLESLLDWMEKTEETLKEHNLSQCSEMAGYRSQILAPLFGELKGRSKSKKQRQRAAELMHQIQQTVLNLVVSYEQKVEEARHIIQQLLSALKQSKLVQFNLGDDFQSFIIEMWSLFSSHEQSKASVVSILALVSHVDAMRILAEEVDIKEWN